MNCRVFFVGSESEVAHHAVPLQKNDSFSTEIVAPDAIVDVATPADIAIFFSEHFDRFRQAIVDLKAKRVATIYLIDGILEWRNAWENTAEEPACPFTMRPALCDKVAAIGASQARVLAGWGNSGRIEIVGIPRLDPSTALWKRSSANLQNEGETFRLLIATAKTPGFTPEQIETTKRSLVELKSALDAQPVVNNREIEVTWRLTAGLDEAIGVENSLNDLSGQELQHSISQCDAFITTPSTSMIESMLQLKPTALLDYHACPCYVPAAWRIHSKESMTSVINQLADPHAAHMHFQNSMLADTIQIAEPATDRLVQLIQSMFASCKQQSASTNSLEFEPNMLPAPSFASELEGKRYKMECSSVFANYNEFTDECDSTQLKAQLAHARREIEHRHRIEAGLRGELAEAHSIFEQIHQHPIAGPIVRLRERFIEFMNRNKEG